MGINQSKPIYNKNDFKKVERLPNGKVNIHTGNYKESFTGQDFITEDRLSHGKINYHKSNDFYEGGVILYKKDTYASTFIFKHGNGKFTKNRDYTYEGSWNMDKFTGVRREKINDNLIYNGEWKDDKRHGKGQILKFNHRFTIINALYSLGNEFAKEPRLDRIYEYEWVNDEKSIYGTILYRNGDVYNGGIIDDKKSRVGKMVYANGDVYEGEFKDDKRHGKGEEHLKDFVIKGEWNNDKFTGSGKKRYSNGDIYEGEFKDDKRHGKGKCIQDYTEVFKGGGVYIREGEWNEDKFTGYGSIFEENQSVYTGWFKDGKKHGKGEVVQDGDYKYEGEWNEDKFTGYKKMEGYGYTYEGYLKNGLYHGEGKAVYNNYIIKGIWENGDLKIKHNLTFPNGDEFYGKWEENKDKNKNVDYKLVGKGTMTYKNPDDFDGVKAYGYWRDGVKHGIIKAVMLDGTIHTQTWNEGYLMSYTTDDKKIDETKQEEELKNVNETNQNPSAPVKEMEEINITKPIDLTQLIELDLPDVPNKPIPKYQEVEGEQDVME